MGLFNLVGKAAKGTVKLAGKGIKMVSKEITKEVKKDVKKASKDLTKATEKKVCDFFEDQLANINENSNHQPKIASTHVTSSTHVENTTPINKKAPSLSYDDQIRMLKDLNELLKEGVLTQEEFNIKKKEILGL